MDKAMFPISHAYSIDDVLGITYEQITKEIESYEMLHRNDNETKYEKSLAVERARQQQRSEYLVHPDPMKMSDLEMKEFLRQRNFPIKRLGNMKTKSLRKNIQTFISVEKRVEHKVSLDIAKPSHSMQYAKNVVSKRKQSSSNIRHRKPEWFRPVSPVDEGQTIDEVLEGFSAPEGETDVKIVAWKYDFEWDAFLVKRVSRLVTFF
ncbi:hypothetical protein HanIR_Chr02g0059481 [Helianthus annuus]|nr:hypothetical protein HanIR_Chr02g0059481 [Helianthus annuus]